MNIHEYMVTSEIHLEISWSAFPKRVGKKFLGVLTFALLCFALLGWCMVNDMPHGSKSIVDIVFALLGWFALVNGMPHGSKNGKRLAKCSHKQPTLSLYYFGALGFTKICGFLMKKKGFECVIVIWAGLHASMHTLVPPHVYGLLQIVLKETRLSLSLSLSLAMTIWCISRV